MTQEKQQRIVRGVAELQKQQRTVQAPGGFTDADAAGNTPRFKGPGRGVAELQIERKKGRLPAFCSLCGTLILLCVIAAFLPLTIPNLLGYQIYEVVSGSMEPEIPVGSVIYVKAAAPEEIAEGEIIAFMRNSSVITHRVEENRFVEGEFITKGDANSKEDVMPVEYDSLIGRVTCHIPVLGILLSVLASGVGKLYAGAFAACGFMFLVLAEKIRERQER